MNREAIRARLTKAAREAEASAVDELREACTAINSGDDPGNCNAFCYVHAALEYLGEANGLRQAADLLLGDDDAPAVLP